MVSKRTSGTEADAILAEVARWGEGAAIGVDRRDEETLELHFSAGDVDYATAARNVEDVLAAANAS